LYFIGIISAISNTNSITNTLTVIVLL